MSDLLSSCISGLYSGLSGAHRNFVNYDAQFSGLLSSINEISREIGVDEIPEGDGFVPIIQKALVYSETKTYDGSYQVDFSGKQIQRYTQAAGGSLTISFTGLEGMNPDVVPTVELQIPITSDVSTISLPASVQVIDMPFSLEGGTGIIHDIVFRAQNIGSSWKVFANYSYQFTV